jgi:hypothetical protein
MFMPAAWWAGQGPGMRIGIGAGMPGICITCRQLLN